MSLIEKVVQWINMVLIVPINVPVRIAIDLQVFVIAMEPNVIKVLFLFFIK
jgi:hypothetical protein